MYKAFKIQDTHTLKMLLEKREGLTLCEPNLFNELVNERYEKMKPDLKSKLSEMIKSASLEGSEINAESIWDDWFPEINADIFISHSSKDAGIARKLAAWLRTKHNLSAFIDSDIWGHSDELLEELDNQYCKNPKSENYSYKKRNSSTAHVHMMLSYALTRMIDKTECFIFLETKNSVTAEDAVEGTYSPWIFHELAMVDTIKERTPQRSAIKQANYSQEFATEGFQFKPKYPLMGKRMIEIGSEVLNEWADANTTSGTCALDTFYELTSKPQLETTNG